jgi:ribonuclease P/MRP protein subunit RPP40
VCHPLAFIFQLLFEDGCLPPLWRKAFITAIYKKGDSTLTSNYRPISLTCTACKIMEAIIKDQLVAYLLSKGLISRQQHAFIKKHSTITNLLQCTHDWAVAVHGGHAVDAIYIDFARAFDSVVHSKLLHKLSAFGISGKLYTWIASFLYNRSQCVVVEHCNSDWLPVISGIPQGTVIGPVLFILFIDDVGEICSGSLTHKLFADDMKLYSTIYTNLDNFSLQSALDRLYKWCCDWQLNVNVSKCHILHMGKNNNHHSYLFNNLLINDSNIVSDLGVEIDESLTYNAHINTIVGKAYSRVGVLFKGFATRQFQS